VVSLDAGGAREVVRDGENGFLLPAPWPGETGPDAARPLAEAMRRLASDPAGARQMGGRWPAEVLRRFDYRAATAEVMKSYAAAGGA
jgi:glycosyltransferase involved in cell wall biosynthesis